MNFYRHIVTLTLLACFQICSQTTISIPSLAFTTATGNDVDDCAIWVHPLDPAKSVVIINDKGPVPGAGGLYVYNLDGTLQQTVEVFQPQNPDIRYNVVLGRDTMDVLVCVDREPGTTTHNKLRVFRINPDKVTAATGFLAEITTSAGIPSGQSETYGHSLYLRQSDGALFSIVSPNSTNDFTQIRLEDDGTGNVKGTIVRTWGGIDISGDLCEGICCDDENGIIYICDENKCVLKYRADPDKKIDTPIGKFALNDNIQGDREGINIYRCSDTTGYILLSSQGNNTIKVYDRISNVFLGTIVPEGMKDCDGLDVTAMSLGTHFPHGMAAFHLGSTAGSQFGFYDWNDIASGLNLAKPCNASRSGKPVGIAARGFGMQPPKARLITKRQYHRNAIILENMPRNITTASITVFDMRGRLIGSFSAAPGLNGISVIPLTPELLHHSTYLMRIGYGNGEYFTEPLHF